MLLTLPARRAGSSVLESARRLYRFELVRWALRTAGPARWRIDRRLRWRLVPEARLSRGRNGVLTYGCAERVHPAPTPGPLPTLGHEIASRPYTVRQPFVRELEQVWLVGKHATPVTRQGRILLTPYRDEPRIFSLEQHPDLIDFIEGKGYAAAWPEHDTVPLMFSAVSRLDRNYSHWLLETCGQLEGVELWTQQRGERPEILISEGGPTFQRASLCQLGHTDDVVAWSESLSPLPVERLLVGSIPGNRVGSSPRSVNWLRRRFLDSVQVADEGGTRGTEKGVQIYIGRARGGRRLVANDSELEGELEKLGYTCIRAEDLAFIDQIRLFRTAQLVVSQHGSGLSNLLFAPHRCRAVELTGGYGDGFFYSLAGALGQPYIAFPCEAEGGHITVDIRRLLQVLETEEQHCTRSGTEAIAGGKEAGQDRPCCP